MKVRRFILFILFLVFASTGIVSFSQVSQTEQILYEKFKTAQKLEEKGKFREAFLHYLNIPGAQHAALRLAKESPEEYLTLLHQSYETLCFPLAKLVEGDLLLARGKNEEALKCFRAVAECVGTSAQDTWEVGFIPPDIYLVDLPERLVLYGIAYPFWKWGPGSHRDNWLIRRFLTLDAFGDAGQEFARVWEIHRRRTQPYIIIVESPAKKGDKQQKWLVHPTGFDGKGLEFAIDYAYFLKRQNQLDRALEVLIEPLLLIDMDKNPDEFQSAEEIQAEIPQQYPIRARPQSFLRESSAGLLHKEYLRLAYGEMKEAGKEAELIATVTDQIAAGENRARRVLARIRYHQGQIEAALALELAYIQQGNFDDFQTAYRQGLAYEENGKPEEAVRAYEQALALSEDKYKYDIEIRLQRLYSSLGKPGKILNISLRQFETKPLRRSAFYKLKKIVQQFQAIGKEHEFDDWARRQLSTIQKDIVRACLLWFLEDYQGCIQAMVSAKAEHERRGDWQSFRALKEGFQQRGKEPYLMLLSALLETDPYDIQLRMEFLDLQENPATEEVIKLFETLLEANEDEIDFTFSSSIVEEADRIRVRNYFDLGYRLMRFYEKEQQFDKLLALGLRIAAGEQPFGKWWKADPGEYQYRDGNDFPEDLNACLSLIVHHANPPMLSQLETLWNPLPEFPAKRQLARRKRGEIERIEDNRPFGWANLPEGVTLIASNENVLTLARDDKYVYAGHPWGIAIYDFQGRAVTRIALEAEVNALAAEEGVIWAGTPKGLFRIEREVWTVSHLWLHHDVPENRRREVDFDNAVYTLALDGDILWIGLHRNIQRLNIPDMTLRPYSYEELKVKGWAGYKRIFPENEYVWADTSYHGSGLRRYDRNTDTWKKVRFDTHPVHLIGSIRGTLFGYVNLGDPLCDRPCIINRKTLEVTPIFIEGDLSHQGPCLNGPFGYFGIYHDKIVFGVSGTRKYLYDEQRRQLKLIRESWSSNTPPVLSIISPDLHTQMPRRHIEGIATCYDDTTHQHTVLGKSFYIEACKLLALPNGSRFLGGKRYYSKNYTYREDLAGLYVIAHDGRMSRISSQPYSDSISGDTVFTLVENPIQGEVWGGTKHGLIMLNSNDAVVAQLTCKDGLIASRITSGVSLNQRLYFLAGWGDVGGGLMVYDPQTTVFTSFHHSDGMDTDKLRSISRQEGRLLLTYAGENVRGDGDDRRYPPGIFDPETGMFTSGILPPVQLQSTTKTREQEPELLPYLGGHLFHRFEKEGKTYFGGTRGLVILKKDAPSQLPVSALDVEIVAPLVEFKQAADQCHIKIESPADLQRFLASPNPYIRERALHCYASLFSSENNPAYIPILGSVINDPWLQVRRRAVKILSSVNIADAVPFLEQAFQDNDYDVWSNAAVGLARLGQPPDSRYLEKILETELRPYNTYSLHDYEAFTAHVTRETFEVFLKYPPSPDENSHNALKKLGHFLNKHPDALDSLLTVYDRWPYMSSSHSYTRFAREIMRFAGTDILPKLHEALKSRNRIIRSNAARGCGAIGDPSSIPFLLEALDLESGLSRASIVWALGELRAKEALPHLIDLYIDARSDEQRRSGSGFRSSQASFAIQSQYTYLQNLDAIASDWEEFKTTDRKYPIDPAQTENLLKPRHIFEAIRKIGPADTQEFYRKLAGEKHTNSRLEAAIYLAACRAEDCRQNLSVLRALMTDNDFSVRANVVVSLFILGANGEVQRMILEWLDHAAAGEVKESVFRAVSRIQDANKLLFARKQLQQIVREEEYSTYSLNRWMQHWAQKMLEQMK